MQCKRPEQNDSKCMSSATKEEETVQVVSIDGRSVHGWDGDRAAVFLRGRSGSSVSIRLARRTQQVPGRAAKPDLPLRTEYKKACSKLKTRELCELHYEMIDRENMPMLLSEKYEPF